MVLVDFFLTCSDFNVCCIIFSDTISFFFSNSCQFSFLNNPY